jgi:hypothetical protein
MSKCEMIVGSMASNMMQVIECYYVNCPTLYVPVRGGRFRGGLICAVHDADPTAPQEYC